MEVKVVKLVWHLDRRTCAEYVTGAERVGRLGRFECTASFVTDFLCLWENRRPRMQRQDAFRPSFKRGTINRPITKTQANSLQNLPGMEALTRWEQVSALSRRHLTGNNVITFR